MENKINKNDFIFYDEQDDQTDISSFNQTEQNDGNKNSVSKNKKTEKSAKHSNETNKENAKKKNIITLCCAAGVVVIGLLVVAGVCIANGKSGSKPVINDASASNVKKDFKYSENTVVSGISIAGKTYEEALKLVSSKEKSFINPVNINVKANGKTFSVSQDDFEYSFDTQKILGDIAKFQESGYSATAEHTYKITAQVKEESIKNVTNKIKDETDKAPQNARVSKFTPYNGDNRFEYAEAEVGYTLNGDDLNKKLKSVISSGLSQADISAEVSTIEAEIQIDEVKKNIVELATYHTVSYNTANGTSNMGVALAACNGSVIEPGDTWSFNECTGDSNLESNGYKPAHVIVDSKITDGIGGGICQASSTIYNAALRSNLTIEERYYHCFASSYVPAGLDATIDYPNLDLKLTNSTKYQIFLECTLNETTLVVTFWGYHDPSYDRIGVENEIGSVEDGKFKTKAWRVYYKDGKEVDREQLGSSVYEASAGYGGGDAANDTGDSTGTVISGTSTSTVSPKPQDSSSNNNSGSSNNSSSNNTPTQPATEKPTEAPATTAPIEIVPTEQPTQNVPTDEPATSGADIEPDSSDGDLE